MRRVLSLLPIAGMMTLAACASDPPPVQIPGMSWSLNQVEGEGAKLAFGRAQSDDVVVMLACEPRSDQVRVSVVADGVLAGPQNLTLSSGGTDGRYQALAEPAGFGGGVVLESIARPDDPVLRNFAASGRLAVDAGGRRTTIPAADPGQARAFMATCAS